MCSLINNLSFLGSLESCIILVLTNMRPVTVCLFSSPALVKRFWLLKYIWPYMDMDVHLVRRSDLRARLMKQFERNDTDQERYQSFIESFFNRILDYRQERNWKKVPVDQCQEFLKFPKVINTQTANTANHIRTDLNKKTGLEIWFFLNQTSFFSLSNYQPKSTLVFLNTTEFINNNFECQLLDEYTDLWSDLAGSDLLNGEHYDCIRFKVPYNYSQSGFNSSSYRGFILYSKVYRWNEQENDLELERHSVHDKRHPNWFFRSTIRFWFCSCRSGSRYFF